MSAIVPNSGHSPIKVMSEIRRLPLLRGSLTERLFFGRNEVALQALLDSHHFRSFVVAFTEKWGQVIRAAEIKAE
jgi:hypothetical protein